MQFTLSDQAAFLPRSVVPLLSLMTLMLGLWYLVLPLPASFQDSLVGDGFVWDLLPRLMYLSTSLPCLRFGDRIT